MRTVLLISNDPGSVREIRLGLRQAPGFRVVATVDGSAPANAALERFAPDVVIVDEMCQRTYALARIREVRELAPGACSVLMSRRIDGTALQDVIDAGAEAVIQMPLPPATFATLLTEVVEGRVFHVPRRRTTTSTAAAPSHLRAVRG